MQVIGFEFREGFVPQRGVKPDAKVVGAHLELLRQQFKGELTPEDVLADAKHNNSPLHRYFEWDDGFAAEQYRLSQARGLIRSVVAIYKQPEREKAPIRIAAYTRVPEGETSHYRSTPDAMSIKSTREAILKQAWRDLQAWRARYAALKEFSTLFEAIDDLAPKIGKAS